MTALTAKGYSQRDCEPVYAHRSEEIHVKQFHSLLNRQGRGVTQRHYNLHSIRKFLINYMRNEHLKHVIYIILIMNIQ